MYMLRLISAVLHERQAAPSRTRPATCARSSSRPRPARRLPARAVRLAGGDHEPQLRPERPDARPRQHPGAVRVIAAKIATPAVDWYALTPILVAPRRDGGLPARRRAAARELEAGRLSRGHGREALWPRPSSRRSCSTTPRRPPASSPAPRPRPARLLAGLIICAPGCSRRLLAARLRRQQPSTTGCWRRTARGMMFLVEANNLMTLFLGLEWFSIGSTSSARSTSPSRLARGRAQVPDRRRLRLGRAPVRLGLRLRGDRGARLRGIAQARRLHRA